MGSAIETNVRPRVPARLTQRKIDAVKANPAKRVEIADAGVPGLYLVVQPSGKKSWAVRYRRADKKPRKFTIPSFPSLATAHKLARDVLNKVAEGRDPAGEKQEAKRAAPTRAELVEDAFKVFLEKHVRTKKGRPLRDSTRYETARLLGLKRDPAQPDRWIASGVGVLAEWKGRKLDSIKSADARDLLDDLVEEAPVVANRTLTALKTCFNFFVRRETLVKSPCAYIDPPAAETSRDRVLSDDELRALWHAADAEGYPFGSLAQLMILTGCRPGEAKKAEHANVHLGNRLEWFIPSDDSKNWYEHLVPLSPEAVALLEKILPQAGRQLLFTNNGGKKISLAKPKRRVHAAMTKELGEESAQWQLHDIRRTVYTGLQRLGYSVEVADAVTNHRSGAVSGIASVYGRYDYAAEKRQALQAWTRGVARILDGKPLVENKEKSAEVIELRAQA